MGSKGAGLDAIELEGTIADLRHISTLRDEFGDLAYPVLRRQYQELGYQVGAIRMSRLIAAGQFSREGFRVDPTAGVRDWLTGYYADRGGDMPEIWAESGTVFLMTRVCRGEEIVESGKVRPVPPREICNAYCRAWAEGYVGVLADLFPGIEIHVHNVSSRREGPGRECVEAFQIIAP